MKAIITGKFMDKRTILEPGMVLPFSRMECTIEDYVGRGSNAIVYIGSYPDRQLKNLKHRVLIKELFPYDSEGKIYRNESYEIYVCKDAQEKMAIHKLSFQRRSMVHLKILESLPQSIDSNINTFECYNTLYTVLGFSGGRSMEKELDSAGTENILLTTHVRRLISVLDVLEEFHSSGFLHLDISPDNIVLIGEGRKERVSLIDYNSVHTL